MRALQVGMLQISGEQSSIKFVSHIQTHFTPESNNATFFLYKAFFFCVSGQHRNRSRINKTMRFTPSIDPKNPLLHDASAKVHVKFGDDSSTTIVKKDTTTTAIPTTTATTTTTGASTATTTIEVTNKKRSSDQAEIKDNKLHKKKKPDTAKNVKPKAIAIGIPGTTPNGPNKSELPNNNKTERERDIQRNYVK